MVGRRSGFGKIRGALGSADSTQASEQSGALSGESKKEGRIHKRMDILGSIASGERVEKTLQLVDPARCRMWEMHNRRYDLLNEQRCEDLIEGIKSQGQQEFPAIVRKVEGDPDYDYEVICGARRHFAISWLRNNNYPQYKFLIEVRQLTDEEAFRLSDVENRDKEDISDYERAVDYLKALDRFYKTQKSMAQRLEVSETWLSQYLDIARLPGDIVSAYFDVTHIRIQHGKELKGLWKDSKARSRIAKEAARLAEIQAEAKEGRAAYLDGQAVIKALKAAAKGTVKSEAKKGVLAEYPSSDGKPMMEVKRQGRSGLVMRILPNNGASKAELLAAAQKAIEEHVK